MPERMRLRLLLANHAEVQNQLLYVSGGAWTDIGPDPSPFAIAATIDVPWEQTNRRHRLQVRIVDVDEKDVLVNTPQGQQPLQILSEFEVGRPPGASVGQWFTVAIAVNLMPLPIPPGRSYIVRGTIDGEPLDELQFRTRPGASVSTLFGQAPPP